MKIDDKLFQALVVVVVIGLVVYKILITHIMPIVMKIYIKIQEIKINYIMSVLTKILIPSLFIASALVVIGFITRRIYFAGKRIKMSEKEDIEPCIQPQEIEIQEEPEDDEYEDEVEEEPEEEEIKEEKQEVKINVNEEIKFHRLSKLNEDEITYLKNHGFRIRTYFNPFNKKRERFIFKTNGYETDQHFLTIQIIADYLNRKPPAENIQTFETVKPDIIFNIKNKKFAVEVETGKILRHARKQLLNKVELLKKNYDDWFFVVTDRNLVSKYRQYGKVFDTRYIKNQLDKFIKNIVK